MGKIPDGILGKLIGKLGPVSGYQRNGQNLLRVAGQSRKVKSTPMRANQREKIKVCNDFTKAFSGTGFFGKSFPSYGDTGTGYNRATSAIMNLAISGTNTDTVISYPRVLISKGPLPAAENAEVAIDTEGNMLFAWTDNTAMGTAKANDKVILVAYFPELKQAITSIGKSSRNEGQALLETSIMKGYGAKTWIGFLSNDEKNASDSVYTGNVEL
jgi:uncharacterized protein DUF6266